MPTRKQRGAETERLVAAAWQTDGWPHAEVMRGPGPDLTGTPGIDVKVLDFTVEAADASE
jgi:hypothetical protein